MNKSLRGRVIVEIIPLSHTRKSGLVILNRKEISNRGKVLSVGDNSQTAKGKPILAPCKEGQVIHYKKYKPMFQEFTQEGMKKGICSIWFEDIVCIEDLGLRATYDNVIIKCLSKALTSDKIIIPEHQDTMEESFIGSVVAIGPDYPDPSLKVGDKIIYPRFEGIKIIYKDMEFLKLKELWCLAKIGGE